MTQNNKTIPQGYKDSALGIIPQEWEVKRLGEVCDFASGGTPSKDVSSYWDGDIPWISASTMHEQNIYDSELRISEQGLNNGSKLAKRDSLLLLVRGSMLWKKIPICLCMKDVAFNQDVKAVIPKDGVSYSMFMLYWFLSNENNLLHKVVGTGIGAGKLDMLDLKDIKVGLPTLREQEKIADILGVWDSAIEKQSALVDALTRRKRALMQQLLTAKKRLPNFTEPWNIVRLGDIGKTYNGLSGKTKDDFQNGNAKYITYVNIFNNSRTNKFELGDVVIKNNDKQNLVKYGDVFFTVSSETANEVGMTSVLLDEVTNTYLNSFCFGLRLHNYNLLLPFFALYYFRSAYFRKIMSIIAQGSTRFNISKTEVLNIQLNIPSIPEQQAIAEVLSTADQEIELAKKRLKAFRTQKSALIQQLLTGKKRVKS